MDTKIAYLNVSDGVDKYAEKAAKIMTLLTLGVKQGKSYKVTVEELKADVPNE
jgi:phosphotransferase system HPr-like phosphotransfer protein